MKRAFADLHLRINPKDQQTFERLIKRAAKFGYNYVSVPFSYEASQEESEKLRAFCQSFGLDFVLRGFASKNRK